MRLVPIVTLASVEIALALGFGIGYVLLYDDCAPPSFTCIFGAHCFALCVNAWSQFPQVGLVGMVVGLPPALASYFATQIATTQARSEHRAGRPRVAVIASIASSAAFVVLFLAFTFGSFRLAVGGSMIELLVVAAGISTLAVFVARREAVRRVLV